MVDGNDIQDWIACAEIAKKYGKEPFFGVFVQASVDDGSFFTVIFNKANKEAIKGGLATKESHLKALEELGVTVER